MANATKTATKSATKSAQVAEIAAVSAVEGDAFANLTASQVKAARKGLDNLRASFASLARCEASVATAIGDLRKGGYHSAAKFTDFNAWVEAATNGDVSRSKAARYDLASQVVQACANSSLSDAVSGLSFLVDKACIELNPPIPAIVTAASDPPVIITSHIPKRM